MSPEESEYHNFSVSLTTQHGSRGVTYKEFDWIAYGVGMNTGDEFLSLIKEFGLVKKATEIPPPSRRLPLQIG